MARKTKQQIDNIIQTNEEYILHWLEDGKTLSWCAEYLHLNLTSFSEGLKRDGIDWKYVREQGKLNKINNELQGSLGEQAIARILDEYNINYKREYVFKDFYYLNTKGHPRFDFAIFSWDNKIRYVIEYDGQRHFAPVDYYGGEQGYKLRTQHDKDKDMYCKMNNIPIIRLSKSPEDITIGDLLI